MALELIDTTNANAAPPGAAAYAGYGNGDDLSYAALVARFPDTPVLEIDALNAGIGDLLDVERSDAVPADVPGWVTGRRAAGVDPWVYVDLATWQACREACVAAGVEPPHWFLADWTSNPALLETRAATGVVAIQYKHAQGNGYDLSTMIDDAPLPSAGGAPAPASAPVAPPVPPQPSTPISKGITMAVSPLVSFKTGQVDVFQVSDSTPWHKWELTPGAWSNEDLATAAGLSTEVAFPDQVPQVSIIAGTLYLTLEDSEGNAYVFAQGQEGGWGVNKLP